MFGNLPLPGVLVVDRYNGYNQVPCKLQYCYAHLMREVEDLAKEFPDNAEVRLFTATFIPQLALAMHLRSQPLTIPRPLLPVDRSLSLIYRYAISYRDHAHPPPSKNRFRWKIKSSAGN